MHVIGGGPSGLIAADILSQNGCTVHVYEQKPSVGRKFLMAGRGGLNLTHSEDFKSFLPKYREAAEFLEPFLIDFYPTDLRAWCEDLGQETFIGSSGRVFPKAMKASPLLRALILKLSNRRVVFHLGHTWKGWDDDGHLIFMDNNNQEMRVESRATLLALGGASWPSLGSDAKWSSFLKDRGIDVACFQPSNCGFTVEWSDFIKKNFAGHPLKSIALTHDDETVRGEAMMDEKGIEGGAVYALSAPIRKAIHTHGQAKITLDLKPDIRVDELKMRLSTPRGKKSFSTWMQKSIHLSPLSIALLHEHDKNISSMPLDSLCDVIKNLPLTLNAPFSMDRSISSAGGIQLSEVDEKLMLKKVPGVFVAGEMLDWEAPTGGYLLQACFSTGVAAAKGILAYIAQK